MVRRRGASVRGTPSGVEVELPILPQLRATIDASACGDLTFLTSEWGKPFTVNSLGNKMRDWCDQAELPHCTLHGLRKAGATIAAENGATDEQLMAIFGWTTKQQTTHYTRRRNAAGWLDRPPISWLFRNKSGRNCPTEKVDDKEWDKNQKKVRQINTGIKVVVPLAGIEPALLAELDFESSASTNSAIGAQAGRPGWARTIRLEARSSTGQFRGCGLRSGLAFRFREATAIVRREKSF
ncbi:hypothetical protein MES4922_90057 [Mesorhizobium ventifaucium]|uniref:Tyr recombinase domain-containing protein n=1 Tax=Mesorhizobium ventifaucium TaxID=666020 RepID=A0ABN8KCW8_9HYPH|nr:hypothetical protein MES4922_90057 [Mesorhizobium ventifaucium]